MIVTTQRDALGLTAEKRAADAWTATEDAFQADMHDASLRLIARMRGNMERIDALPAGTMVRCHIPGCGPHPIEMYR